MNTKYLRYPWDVINLFLIEQFGCSIETREEWYYCEEVPF